MRRKTDVADRAMRQVANLAAVEERLEKEPLSLLGGAFGLAEERASGIGFEAVRPSGDGEIRAATEELEKAVARSARRAIAKVREEGRDAALSPDEELGLEAIILVTGRPAILIQNGSFARPPEDWRVLEEARPRIEEVFKSVGRVEVTGHPTHDWIGTGFLVAEDVIMTNRHVAREFARQGARRKWTFEPGMAARIDYVEELAAAASLEFDLTEVIGVHDVLDLALLRAAPRTSGATAAPAALTVSSDTSRLRKGRKVYVVGYPAFDSRNDPVVMLRIFAEIFNVKRLQPGEVMKAPAAEPLLQHDCSTLGGNSGSCVVDLETHEVVGLHFGGRFREANQAVALGRLTKDPLLRKAKVNFH